MMSVSITAKIMASLLGLTAIGGALSQATFTPPPIHNLKSALNDPSQGHSSYLVGAASRIPLMKCDTAVTSRIMRCKIRPAANGNGTLALQSGSKIVVFEVARDAHLGDLIQIALADSEATSSPRPVAAMDRFWVRASDLYFANLKELGPAQ